MVYAFSSLTAKNQMSNWQLAVCSKTEPMFRGWFANKTYRVLVLGKPSNA